MVEPKPDSPGVIMFPPLLFSAVLLAGLAVHFVIPVRLLPALPARATGALILAASLALARSAKEAMRRAGTNIRPDQSSTAVVTDGPFRFTRNPLYIATTGLYLGFTLLVDTLWPLVLLVPLLVVVEWGIIRREERYLEAKFGDAYRGYRSRVRRWI